MSEQIISIGSLILTFLSFIVTIIGWSVTYRSQRQILERQIQAEKNTKNHEIVFSQRLEQLNEIKNWFREGEYIWRLSKTPNNDVASEKVREKYIEWESNLGKIKANASIVDSHFPTPPSLDFGCFGNAIVIFFVFIISGIIYLIDDTSTPPNLDELFQKQFSFIQLTDSFFEKIKDSVVNKSNKEKEEAEIVDVFGKAISKIDKLLTNRLLAKGI